MYQRQPLTHVSAPLDQELDDLRRALRSAPFPFATPDSQRAKAQAAAAADQLGDYIIPRLRSIDAPLLTVVGGSTGAGKSALVNSLVGHEVSRSGVLRPTTRQPVLVHHPADLAWFDDDRILPGLPRVTGGLADTERAADGPAALHLMADDALPPGLALLDAPDIDSVSGANRELAATLMAAADLWLFLTTAARYADAVPWAALRAAAARHAVVGLVLNRVPYDAVLEVSSHLRSLLTEEGLAESPLFVIAEEPLVEGMIDPAAVAGVRGWLSALAGDPKARADVARRTLDGALAALAAEVNAVSRVADGQVASAARLREMAHSSFAAGAARVNEVGADGSMLRGEVLARWQEFVGAGTITQGLESRVSRWRDAVGRVFRGQPAAPEPAVHALESGVARVLVDEIGSAYERADSMWRDDPVGRAIAESADLAVPPPSTSADAEALVRDWQDDVLRMVREEGADKRGTARAMAYGVNGAALSLMVVAFGATGGITGAEVGIAGGSAVVAQKLLEAMFSEDAVRRMSTTARERLEQRVADAFAGHERSFTDQLDRLELDPDVGPGLRRRIEHVLAVRAELARDLGPPTAGPVTPSLVLPPRMGPVPRAAGGPVAPAVTAAPEAPAEAPARKPRRRARDWFRRGGS